MKKYSIIKGLISTILIVSCVFGTVTTANALNSTLVNGASETDSVEVDLATQFIDLLNNATSEQERAIILNKAYQMGLTTKDLNVSNLSENDKAILLGTKAINTSNKTDRSILTGSSFQNSDVSICSTVAGVSMPDYALWPTIYKQTTSTYCSAATVYTVAKYIGANPPSQANIMAFWKSQWNVTYPDLPLMRNYLNNHLSGKPSDYVPYVNKQYAGSQATFNNALKNNVLNYQPMILLMKNSSGTTNWPYTTGGHFCICSGLLTWENNKYFIGDPYYFSSYVSGATANDGEHKRTWTQLNNVITNRFGSGSQYCLT